MLLVAVLIAALAAFRRDDRSLVTSVLSGLDGGGRVVLLPLVCYTTRTIRVPVPAGLGGVTAIAAGGDYSLALKGHRTVVA